MGDSPYKHVPLPDSVEMALHIICEEKNQAPIKPYVRTMLAEIGEQPALELLKKIHSSNPVHHLGGLIGSKIKERYPILHANVLIVYGYASPSSPVASPHSQNICSPSSMSPRPQNGGSFQSPVPRSANSTSSGLHNTSPHNVSRGLSFDDETLQGRSPNVRSHSSHVGEHKNMAEPVLISQQLMILSQLEYRKLFLVLSYTGRKKLECVITVDAAAEIAKMKEMPMIEFETFIWNKYGQSFCEKAHRCQYLDWDSRKTHQYYCYVFPDRSYYFKGPYRNFETTHLHNSLGDENVLIVKFLEDGAYGIKEIVQEGILVGLRRYQYFVFKAEHRKGKKRQRGKEDSTSTSVGCYFVYTDTISNFPYDQHHVLYKKSIGEARRMFMHVHTLSSIEKYMARFSLILSKTKTLKLDFGAVLIERIDDIPFKGDDDSIILDEDGKPILHTDGTGYISLDLAMKCPKDLTRAKYVTDDEECDEYFEPQLEGKTHQRGTDTRSKDPPLLMQCRLFYDGYAVKGTLLVNRKLKPGTIQIRPSMIKVEKDELLRGEEPFKALEIVNVSSRPGKNFLSRNLISLLSYGGVPREFFLNLLKDALEETQRVYSDKRAALRVASNNDSFDYGLIAERMIACGVPLNEPYLQFCLSILESAENTNLKGGKIPISESFYLMGTADPTNTLTNDQVCVILDSGCISGKVLVYRNPGLHFGDVHVMEAVFVKELEEIVGNAKYGIFFSTQGCRSAAYEIATGDFDGDLYWVSRNPELLKYYKPSQPWTRLYPTPEPQRSPRKFSELDLEHDLVELFLESRKPSFSMATASDSWLSFMDRMLTLGDDEISEKETLKEKILRLIDIYYDALDAPKSGKKVMVPKWLIPTKYPHHMGRAADFSYTSKSILGQIYDTVTEFKNEVKLMKEIWKLPCFDTPIPELYHAWKEKYANYRRDMSGVMNMSTTDEVAKGSRGAAATDVINKYKQLLYDAPELEESAKNSEMIYEEAVAIYHVTYDYAMGNGIERCGFAWKVAGSALWNLCAWKLAGPKEKPIAILPSVLRDVLRR